MPVVEKIREALRLSELKLPKNPQVIAFERRALTIGLISPWQSGVRWIRATQRNEPCMRIFWSRRSSSRSWTSSAVSINP